MALPMIYQNSRDAQGAAQENGMAPEEDGEPVSEQEQTQYDDLVTGGMTLLYRDGKATVAIAKKLQEQAKDTNIATAIGQHAALVMLQLVRGLKEQGFAPDPDVVLNAGVEIIAEVAEIAQNVPGLLPNEQYDKVIEEACYEATRYFGEKELEAGEITPEMQQEAQGIVSANMPKDKGSLAGMGGQPPPQQQPPAQGPSLAQMSAPGAM